MGLKNKSRSAALAVLDQVRQNRILAVQAMRQVADWSLLSQEDRGLANQLVLGVLRHRLLLDHLLDELSTRKPPRQDPRLMDILRMGLFQLLFLDRIPAHAGVGTTVELVRRIKGPQVASFANGLLRQAAESTPAIKARMETLAPALRGSMPDFIHKELIQAFPEHHEEELAALLLHSHVTYRILNNRDPNLVVAGLKKWGLEPRLDPAFPEAVILPPDQSAYETGPWLEGWLTPQDPASQRIVELAGVGEGRRILEIGAGLGTKTRQILDHLVNPDQELTAMDISDSRLDRLSTTTADPRLRLFCGDATDSRQMPPGPWDRIILDAPCSGLGTLRRHPEIKWWRTPQDIGTSHSTQVAMVKAAARVLSPGGILVYAVCSFTRAEGPDVIARLLKSMPEMKLVPVSREHGGNSSGFFTTSASRDDTDLFFAAVMTKD